MYKFMRFYVTCYLYAVLGLVTQSWLTLQPHGLYSLPGSSVHGDSPGKNTGVVCHALLHGIFPTQGIELKSPSLQAESLQSEPPGKPTLPLGFLIN